MNLEKDIRIQDYQIHLPPMGEGAYGRVYRATYRGISERAVKIFRSGAVDLSTVARELEKLSSVAEHHGIVTLHDFDLLSDPPYYAMGLHADQRPDGGWESRTLERLCGHVDQREGWRLLREIADALAYLHRHHTIHCDVKPSNVLLTDETPFGIKICDFGQSRGDALEGFKPAGTPLYASPEQLRDPRESADGKGFRWDVYSFGVVAYKLLTGRLPRLQGLSDSEQKSYDLEATIQEGSLDSTVAEDGDSDDEGNEKLAALTEAEPVVRWPAEFRIPSERRDLIDRCLDLDPDVRFADMREVWIGMQQTDQQRIVRRARRLNALFAILLVIAIWATGFAFFQARRAKQASEDATHSREQAEELVFFIVNKLNRDHLSEPGLGELYDHIADNAETYLDNLPKNRRSKTLLRISANTASLRGRQALDKGDLDEALMKFRNAYEIRSKLATDSPGISDLRWQASEDLIAIGSIFESRGEFDAALEIYEQALTERTDGVELSEALSYPDLRRITECLTAVARVHRQDGDPEKAVDALARAVSFHDTAAETASPDMAIVVGTDLLQLLKSLGAAQYEDEKQEDAILTFQRMLDAADSIRAAAGGEFNPEAANGYADALGAIGRIQLEMGQATAAATLFRQEIPLRERAAEQRPYDPNLTLVLAEAYANLAACLDLTDRADRSLALFHLQQAALLMNKIPNEQKKDTEIRGKLENYNQRISEILEMEE